jgi:GH15 family glucan-1,4-alpha-glucosidase
MWMVRGCSIRMGSFWLPAHARNEDEVAEQKRVKNGPLHSSPIEDYALIGDCQTGALVSRSGSIDWLCWPTFSSGACFAAILGTRDHGHWQIVPTKKLKSCTRQYLPHTMVVETTFETGDGVVTVTDFMPSRGDEHGAQQEGHSSVMRIVHGVRGKVTMRMDLAIRFDYGRTVPWVTKSDHELRAVAGPDMVTLRVHCNGVKQVPLDGEGMSTISEFTMKEGQTVSMTLTNSSSLEAVPQEKNAQQALVATQEFWRTWAERNCYKGEFEPIVERSLMMLKALTYDLSGGIVAALTTSLPEKIGGERNWDYRYCWLRDTSFTLLVLMRAGYTEEAVSWRRWLLRAVAGAPEQVQTIYGICGERQLPEWDADWLPGYENSLPVHIGNGASGQFQLDVFGEVVAALSRTPQAEDDIRVSASALQAAFVNHLCKIWTEPDEGIWETRGSRKHFVHSKVMAWVALDRAIRQKDRYAGTDADLKRWVKNRDMLHKEICDKGFNKKLNSFTQSYGSKELDASCLRIALVGFLPPDDPRIIGTVAAIEKRLMKDGFVMRYDTKTSSDGLPSGEGAFLACSFWLVTNLWLIGRRDDALAMYRRLLALANDVGLLSEEYDPKAKRMLGNFPQALSHIALVHAAFTISGLWAPDTGGGGSADDVADQNKGL